MKSLKSLNPYFYKYRYRLLLGFLFVAVSNILLITQGDVIKNSVNQLQLYLKIGGNYNQFVNYALIMLALALGSGLFMFLKRQFIIVVSRYIEADLKNDIYKHYQHLDQLFYKRSSTGDLMNRISEDVAKVRMYVGPAVMYLVDTVVTITTVLIFMLNENVWLTIAVVSPLPFLSFAIFKISNRINKRSTEVQEELSVLTSRAQESYSGIRVLKGFSRERAFVGFFTKQSDNYRSAVLKLVRTEAMFQPLVSGMIGFSLIAIIFIGGKLYAQGGISIGSLPQFVYFVFKLTWPFASLGWVSSLVQRAAASQTRINAFLDTKPVIEDDQSIFSLEESPEIAFKNVSYTYPDTGIVALKDISLKIEMGTTLGVLGTTGSGKTTLCDLMMRVYDVSSGSIHFDHKDLREFKLYSLRNNSAYVTQDTFLFSDTIVNNINFALDNDSQSFEKVKSTAEKVALLETIESFSEKFETMIGERGVMLSGGQKQRIALARGLIKDPKLVILDDVLSALDAVTEKKVISTLKNELKNKTCVITSHRISAVKHADQIIYLKNGEIHEQGTHEELISKKGEYFKLAQIQEVE